MSNKSLLLPGYQEFGKPVCMNERAKVIGQNVRKYRKLAGLSQHELAKRIKVRSQNTIAAIETGKTQKSRHLTDIAREVRVNLSDLDPQQGNVAEWSAKVIPASTLVGDRDLPLHGTVEAGDGILVMSSTPVDYVQRPEPLARVRDGYGVIVVGESMIPALRPGDTALVNPHLPPRSEDLCIFISEENGDFRAIIKEYVSQTKELWRVKRYRPKEEEFTLRKRDWPRCDVVVGKYARR